MIFNLRSKFFLTTVCLFPLFSSIYANARFDDLETKAAETLIKVSRLRGVSRIDEMHTKASEKVEARHYYEMKSHCIDKMVDMLHLTDEQAREIVSIYDKVHADFNSPASMSLSALPSDSRAEIIKKTVLEADKKVVVLLTPEQKTQFPAFKRYRRRVVRLAYAEKISRQLSMEAGGMSPEEQTQLKELYLTHLEKNNSSNILEASPSDKKHANSELRDSINKRFSLESRGKKDRARTLEAIKSAPDGAAYFLIY